MCIENLISEKMYYSHSLAVHLLIMLKHDSSVNYLRVPMRVSDVVNRTEQVELWILFV